MATWPLHRLDYCQGYRQMNFRAYFVTLHICRPKMLLAEKWHTVHFLVMALSVHKDLILQQKIKKIVSCQSGQSVCIPAGQNSFLPQTMFFIGLVLSKRCRYATFLKINIFCSSFEKISSNACLWVKSCMLIYIS